MVELSLILGSYGRRHLIYAIYVENLLMFKCGITKSQAYGQITDRCQKVDICGHIRVLCPFSLASGCKCSNHHLHFSDDDVVYASSGEPFEGLFNHFLLPFSSSGTTDCSHDIN